jgi:hypothetical protein
MSPEVPGWPVQRDESEQPFAHRREPWNLMILCLLLSASALSATIADGPRTEPRVQANSTILTCAVEDRQTQVANCGFKSRLVKWRQMCETVSMGNKNAPKREKRKPPKKK